MTRRKSEISIPKFYVYTLARPNGKVFYVGKGIGDRIDYHEREAAKGHKCHKCNVIRKIWRDGGDVIKSIVFFNLPEDEAFRLEALLIAKYGLNNLTNIQPGETISVSVNLRPPSRPVWQLNAVEYRALMVRQGYSKKDIEHEMRRFYDQQLDDLWRMRQRAIINHQHELKERLNDEMIAVRIARGRKPCQEELFCDTNDRDRNTERNTEGPARDDEGSDKKEEKAW